MSNNLFSIVGGQVAKVISQTTGNDGMPRYMLELLSSGTRISLKPSNLIPVENANAGGGFGGIPGGFGGMPNMQGMMNSLPPWLQEKLRRGETPGLNDLKRLFGVEDIPTSSVYILAVVFVFLFLKASMLKAALVTSILG
jgi:hypothetical protein